MLFFVDASVGVVIYMYIWRYIRGRVGLGPVKNSRYEYRPIMNRQQLRLAFDIKNSTLFFLKTAHKYRNI